MARRNRFYVNQGTCSSIRGIIGQFPTPDFLWFHPVIHQRQNSDSTAQDYVLQRACDHEEWPQTKSGTHRKHLAVFYLSSLVKKYFNQQLAGPSILKVHKVKLHLQALLGSISHKHFNQKEQGKVPL